MRHSRAWLSVLSIVCVGSLADCSGGGSPLGGVSPQAVRAAKISCTPITSGPTWPYSAKVQGCTGVTANTLSQVLTALRSVVVKYTVAGPKLQHLAPPVWIFHDVADYSAYWGSAANSPLPTSFAVTYVTGIRAGGPNGGKPYTLIFEEAGTIANPYPGHVAAHEMGHWIDQFVEGSVKYPYSLQKPWVNEVAADWGIFNELAGQCSLPSQVFNGERPYPDLISTRYICANSGNGPGLGSGFSGNNESVLQTAWPMIFADRGGSSYYKEIFADEVATDAGVLWPDLDTYFIRNEWWLCTQTLLKSQLVYGAPPGTSPSPYKWPARCPNH